MSSKSMSHYLARQGDALGRNNSLSAGKALSIEQVFVLMFALLHTTVKILDDKNLSPFKRATEAFYEK